MEARPVGPGWRIEPLVETTGRPAGAMRGGALPEALSHRYGPELAIALRPDRPTIVANFVTTLDGVVAFDTMGRTGGREISGGFAPDRFLMGLLRATADAVLVGAGTVRSGAGHVWSPDHVHPSSAEAFADWRVQLGLTARQPATVMVSTSGRIDPAHPALHRPDVPVLIVTTAIGRRRLESSGLPSAVEVVLVEGRSGAIDVMGLRDVFIDRRLELVVCEGGPTLFGSLVAAGLVDELFLTVAPQIAGRGADHPRLALVEGLAYQPGATPWATLGSVRRAGDHLFLRYALMEPAARPESVSPRTPNRGASRSTRPRARQGSPPSRPGC
ncbi:MAG: dihydrofolate reductase family protein [Chloroflexi bacterium]|nr:dihydrofolate reductase family protein [Chloroflexota bacterium]